MVRLKLVLLFLSFCLVSFVVHAEEGSATARVAEALKLLKDKTSVLGTPRVENGVLYFSEAKINDDFTVVDALKKEKGCSATLFVKKGDDFLRISTNVMNDDKRAVGTVLAAGDALKALTAGKGFYGVIEVVGTKMEVGYEPIMLDKTVIGAYFVGFPVDK